MKRKRKQVPPLDVRPWRTAEELFLETGMSPATINRYARGELEPKLPSYPVGKRKRLFRETDVDSWLDKIVQGRA